MVPPCSDKITRVPSYSSVPTSFTFRLQGYHLLRPDFPGCSAKLHSITVHWAGPRSLAATRGISVDFFSSGYLDVSVPRVRLHTLCIQIWILRICGVGCPIRKSPDQSQFADSPRLNADYHVLHRLLLPRHPPYAPNRLTI